MPPEPLNAAMLIYISLIILEFYLDYRKKITTTFVN